MSNDANVKEGCWWRPGITSRCAHPGRPDTHITPASTNAHAPPPDPRRNPAQGSPAAPAKHFGNTKTGSRWSRCLAKSPFSLGKKSRGGEKWGSGPESLPRSPCPPDAKRGGERGGRTHPGPPMARPRLPQPRARLRARPPRPLRAEPSRARRLPTETSPLPLGRPRARPPAPL
ncbi:unnamed protein product [Rangifer tarandus platyrhynchus]|uniref:Uncharacterized protein n=1 Tax=Rangifer tarandus platyrhynchus TaxID=3082113 RepID=A0AC59ZDC1_RANTA